MRGGHWPLRLATYNRYGPRRMSSRLYMDAVITPNRSLSDRGFIALIAVVTIANCASAAVFYFMGATLVPVFFGVDVAALIIALAASIRAVRNVERVQVSAGQVRVLRENPRASSVIWESPTAFTRVDVETQDERAVAVRLALSGREAVVAGALSPRERKEFAGALMDAIRQARLDRS
jgi:uncharacterized membrane protein